MHACDGQTDRQTDRILLAIPRLHYMQRGKNLQHTELLIKHTHRYKTPGPSSIVSVLMTMYNCIAQHSITSVITAQGIADRWRNYLIY